MRTAPGPSSGSTLGLPQAVFMERMNKVSTTFHDHHPHRLWGSGRDVCVFMIRNWKLTFYCVWFVYSIPYYHRFSQTEFFGFICPTIVDKTIVVIWN